MAGAAGAAGGSSCPAGSHAVGSECVSTLAAWSSGPSLSGSRDHHVTFVVDSKYLYAAGGVRDMKTPLSSVERSAIASDGSLGPWEAATQLPEASVGAGLGQVGDTIVVAGGIRISGNSGAPSTRTDVGHASADGSVSWSVGPELSVSRFHAAAVAVGAHVFVIGGLTGAGTDNTPAVERAEVQADGSVGAWQMAKELPEKRSHQSVAATEDAIYVVGGLTGDPAGVHTTFSDVLRATVSADGSLGDWTTVGSLPVPLATHSSLIHLGYLYVLGGVEGNPPSEQNTAAVRRAKIEADGSVGEWESLESLPKARAHCHQTPLVNGIIYSVAGAFEHASMTDVFLGTLE